MANWTRLECELIVKDYMAMYEHEMHGERYSKAEHRRQLQPRLNNRSEGSIEYKHQNISAVLIGLGFPYISGYKPAGNYQSMLKSVVGSYLSANEEIVIAHSDKLVQTPSDVPKLIDWRTVLTDAPERLSQTDKNRDCDFTPRKYNYLEREAANSRLGILGEQFILDYERNRLCYLRREDLAEEVEWTSQVKGDGAGYDIRSFDGEKDEELFIEVKTTNSGKYQPFFVTDNEVEFSKTYAAQYAIYRVFQFRDMPRLFTLPGDLKDNANLWPKTYKVSF